MTVDEMYRAVHALDDDDDQIAKRLQELINELGEEACAVLDELLNRDLLDAATEYLQLEERRSDYLRTVMRSVQDTSNRTALLERAAQKAMGEQVPRQLRKGRL